MITLQFGNLKNGNNPLFTKEYADLQDMQNNLINDSANAGITVSDSDMDHLTRIEIKQEQSYWYSRMVKNTD